jgi:hypothetical protein
LTVTGSVGVRLNKPVNGFGTDLLRGKFGVPSGLDFRLLRQEVNSSQFFLKLALTDGKKEKLSPLLQTTQGQCCNHYL